MDKCERKKDKKRTKRSQLSSHHGGKDRKCHVCAEYGSSHGCSFNPPWTLYCWLSIMPLYYTTREICTLFPPKTSSYYLYAHFLSQLSSVSNPQKPSMLHREQTECSAAMSWRPRLYAVLVLSMVQLSVAHCAQYGISFHVSISGYSEMCLIS